MAERSPSAIKILVIDDEEDLRKLLRIWLEQAGYAVFEADNGSQAAAICRAGKCSLVICDLFMDQKEGIETIQELRREFPTVRLIAISGGGTKKLLDLLPVAQALGAAETLAKPFDRLTLLDSIDRVLDPQAG